MHTTFPALCLQNSYKGRALHPTVASKLRALYRPGIRRLQVSGGEGEGVQEEVAFASVCVRQKQSLNAPFNACALAAMN